MLERMIDLDYQGETGLVIHKGGKKEYVWSVGDPLELELVLPCPVINVNSLKL